MGIMATAPGWRMYSRRADLPSGMRTSSSSTWRRRPRYTVFESRVCSVKSLSLALIRSLERCLDRGETQPHQVLGEDAEDEHGEPVHAHQQAHVEARLDRRRVRGRVEI